jgi:hypothetical protein
MATLDVSNVTTGTIDGTGTFDVLMQTVFLHLQREYASGRITGDMYAKAYIEIMNNTVAQATQYVVAAFQATANDDLVAAQIRKINKDIELVTEQIELIGYQGIGEQAKYLDVVNGQVIAGTIGKQKDVYTAQTKGFKDSALQSVAKTMIDTWSVRRSTDEGTLTTPESKLYDGNIGNAVEAMLTNLNVPIAPPPAP